MIVPVTGLQPSKTYPYQVFVDDHQIPVAGEPRITTAPDSSVTGKARIAFGSCPHRWGLGNHELWEQIQNHKPSAMLIYGDIAVQDKKDHLGLHRSDYQVRDWQKAWQAFAASIPIYATWDDHDYISNDKAGVPSEYGYTADDRWGIRTVWTQAWNNPSYGFDDERGGIFLKTRIGPCDIIMLDNRYFRKNVEGSFLEEEQLSWLESQLLLCKGPFIIISCGTMWSDNISAGKDSWGVWDPAGRERIFSFIEQNNIKGVLLLSGDRHGARVVKIPRPTWSGFWEFEPGSLGRRSGGKLTDSTNVLYRQKKIYAFGELTFDATLNDPEVMFNLIQADGEVLFDTTIKRSELTPDNSVQSVVPSRKPSTQRTTGILPLIRPQGIYILRQSHSPKESYKLYSVTGKQVTLKKDNRLRIGR